MDISDWSSYWLTADVNLIEQSVEIAGVMITASASTKTVVSIYDGVNSSGRLLATYRVAADTSKTFKFPQVIPCTRGFYVDVDANVTGVMVFYRPVK
jgi:hypothetical protein